MKGYDVDRAELIKNFTNGEKDSLRTLNREEFNSFIKDLKTTYNIGDTDAMEAKRKSIKTAVHYLCLMGMTTGNDRPDLDRINRFVENIGSNNPRKVTLNYLSPGELNKVVTQIKAMYQKEVSR